MRMCCHVIGLNIFRITCRDILEGGGVGCASAVDLKMRFDTDELVSDMAIVHVVRSDDVTAGNNGRIGRCMAIFDGFFRAGDVVRRALFWRAIAFP